MRYVIGALIGALLAVLLGIPSFTIDRQANVEPPLFRIYCDLNQTDRWDFKCVPGAGTAVIILTGAALGAVGAAAFRRRRSDPSPTIKSATPRSREQSESQFDNPKAAYLEPQRRTAAVVQASAARIKTRDDIILEAALEISESVERTRDRTGEQAIPRKFATLHISDEIRDRATQLRIINLPNAAVERALEMGVLESQGTGPDEMLSRTSQPLRPASVPNESTSESASDESTHEGSAESSSAASETGRAAPELFEELESLIRLHERGVLTDAELEAAKARLLSEDDG